MRLSYLAAGNAVALPWRALAKLYPLRRADIINRLAIAYTLEMSNW